MAQVSFIAILLIFLDLLDASGEHTAIEVEEVDVGQHSSLHRPTV